MTPLGRPNLVRVRFAPGDPLRARDLRSAVGHALALARLHQAAAHADWGIVRGLDVRCANDGGAVVSPGVACDILGRVIGLDRARSIPWPEPRGREPYLLTVRCPEPALPPGPDDPEAANSPVIRWRAEESASGAADEAIGVEIPLARLTLVPGGRPELDSVVRRPVRRSWTRLRMAGGRFSAGSVPIVKDPRVVRGLDGTAWTQWSVVLDLAAAGFTTDPAWVVTLEPPADARGRFFAAPLPSATRKLRLDVFQTDPLAPGEDMLPVGVSWVGVEDCGGQGNPDRPALDPAKDIREDRSMSDRPPALSRAPLVFAAGDRLRADQFTQAFDLLRDLRWLHNREFHDWGIVRGCGVSPGARTTEVRVEDGVAQDALGRELLVPYPFTVPLPAEVSAGPDPRNPTEYYLTLSYDGNPQLLEEKATVRWQAVVPTGTADVRHGLDVIAARVSVVAGRVAEVDPRRAAPPSPARPRTSPRDRPRPGGRRGLPGRVPGRAKRPRAMSP